MLKFFFVWGSKKILSDICRINTSEPLKFDVILFLVGWQVSALPLNLNMAYIIPWAGREFYCMDRPVIHRTELENSSLEVPGITTECSNFWKFESSSFKQGDLPHAIKYECKKAFSYYKENSSELTFARKYFWAIPSVLTLHGHCSSPLTPFSSRCPRTSTMIFQSRHVKTYFIDGTLAPWLESTPQRYSGSSHYRKLSQWYLLWQNYFPLGKSRSLEDKQEPRPNCFFMGISCHVLDEVLGKEMQAFTELALSRTSLLKHDSVMGNTSKLDMIPALRSAHEENHWNTGMKWDWAHGNMRKLSSGGKTSCCSRNLQAKDHQLQVHNQRTRKWFPHEYEQPFQGGKSRKRQEAKLEGYGLGSYGTHCGLGENGFRPVGERKTWDTVIGKDRWLIKSQQASQSPHYDYGQCFIKPPFSLNYVFLCHLIYQLCRCLEQEYVMRESS